MDDYITLQQPGSRLCWQLSQRLAALILLFLLLPIMALVAFAVVATSRGGTFYIQERPGHRGKRIFVPKFRTMYIDADKDAARARRVAEDDPFVTPLGRFLRASKLDELPQLWNVVTGDMVLVGPRPIAYSLHDELVRKIPNFEGRLCAIPGITSLGQLEALDDDDQELVIADWRRRHAIDSHYLCHRSVPYDMVILLLTLAHVGAKIAMVACLARAYVQGSASDPPGMGGARNDGSPVHEI